MRMINLVEKVWTGQSPFEFYGGSANFSLYPTITQTTGGDEHVMFCKVECFKKLIYLMSSLKVPARLVLFLLTFPSDCVQTLDRDGNDSKYGATGQGITDEKRWLRPSGTPWYVSLSNKLPFFAFLLSLIRSIPHSLFWFLFFMALIVNILVISSYPGWQCVMA